MLYLTISWWDGAVTALRESSGRVSGASKTLGEHAQEVGWGVPGSRRDQGPRTKCRSGTFVPSVYWRTGAVRHGAYGCGGAGGRNNCALILFGIRCEGPTAYASKPYYENWEAGSTPRSVDRLALAFMELSVFVYIYIYKYNINCSLERSWRSYNTMFGLIVRSNPVQ